MNDDGRSGALDGLLHSFEVAKVSDDGLQARNWLDLRIKIWRLIRRQRETDDLRTQALEPKRQPRTLESGVSGQQNALRGPEILVEHPLRSRSSMAPRRPTTDAPDTAGRAAYPSGARTRHGCRRRAAHPWPGFPAARLPRSWHRP